ncbi:MAG: mannose-1-phosphate guanylyltransferase/mannose-6-phosphate isomerase [Magnetococcales bacterium]|nr:mannose-1-phosphate guanylyltransferase/mannose-6-phosphate isomerase [Magnetococcales bacterium]
MAIIPVILSGGMGSRLWPLSRESYPKQFLRLTSEKTLFQETVQRVTNLENGCDPLLICNVDHRFLAAEQLRQMAQEVTAILLEPMGRNTAPAVACGALQAIEAQGEEALILVLPADHVIADKEAFQRAVALAETQAEAGHLVTFGIVPNHPETGFGYIKRGAPLDADGVFHVDAFVEKPDLAIATGYVESGEYAWNSGMFLFRADRYIAELERFEPEILAACRRALDRARLDLDFIRLDEEAFAASPANSIDYAVMERTDDAVVIPIDVGWSDVGSWSALWKHGERDAADNVTQGDVAIHDVHGSYLRSRDRMIAAIGIDNCVVVDTADAVLVASKDRVQDVKALVDSLKSRGKDDILQHHTRVFRPWGNYETVDCGDRFQVKRIVVKPGEILSLQLHHHRTEHWVVVKGTASVTRGDETILLSEDQSTYIPLGVKHRLENVGKIPLELIEVQSGSYLGEDDIVRLEDKYGR